MTDPTSRRRMLAVASGFATLPLVLGACSAGSLGSSEDEGGGNVSLTFLTNNDPNNVKTAEALGLPVGTVKTRLYRTTTQMRALLDADARLPLTTREAT